MAFFIARTKTGYYSLLLASFVCILSAVIFPSDAMARPSPEVSEQTCFIRGKVIDMYGTYVPGAEVRLMLASGECCGIPDNPVLSGACIPGDEGSFEFRDVPMGQYFITAARGQSNGSVSISLHENHTYVEITLPGYVHKRFTQDPDGSPVPLMNATLPVSPIPEATTGKASDIKISEPKTDLLQVIFSGLILLTGAFLAIIVLKKR